jgi:hypothetical protein
MRQELIELLTRFEQRAITVEELRSRIYALFKGGVEKTLLPEEATKLNDFFAWYLDMFNPNQPPRPGISGRIKDRFAQFFRGEYRVSESSLRTKAEELRKVLLSVEAQPAVPHKR